MADIIESIDAVLVCQMQGCDKPLGESPSDHFCSPNCQQRWHESHVPIPTWYSGAESGTNAGVVGRVRRWGDLHDAPRRSGTVAIAVEGGMFTIGYGDVILELDRTLAMRVMLATVRNLGAP
jgi:hypothetical protein